MQTPLGLADNLLRGPAQHDAARLAQRHAGELQQGLVTDSDLGKMTVIDRSRQDKRNVQDKIKACFAGRAQTLPDATPPTGKIHPIQQLA